MLSFTSPAELNYELSAHFIKVYVGNCEHDLCLKKYVAVCLIPAGNFLLILVEHNIWF